MSKIRLYNGERYRDIVALEGVGPARTLSEYKPPTFHVRTTEEGSTLHFYLPDNPKDLRDFITEILNVTDMTPGDLVDLFVYDY